MISIILDRENYKPGMEITAQIHIKLKKEIRARGIFATLICTEKRLEEVRRVMDSYDYLQERDLGVQRRTHIKTEVREISRICYSKDVKLAGEGIYKEEEFVAKFLIPRDAKTTSYEFGHDNAIYVWRIKVKIDIPFALDKNAQKEVMVV
ncbi:MAG: hypothetical protein QXW70_02245 [Candidatus Anstonellales archaeon]